MTSLVNKPLGRFRKHGSHKPLHERWGDVGITVPTEGSWNQLDNPHRSSDRRPVHDISSRGHRDQAIVPTEDDRHASQSSSFSVKALNPRRLSMRISQRSKQTTDCPKEDDRHTKAERRVSQFSYRPIQQDYPTEMAEKAARQSQHAPRFRYIPTGPGYAEELGLGAPRRLSSCRESAQSSYASESTDRGTRHSYRRSPIGGDAYEEYDEDGYHGEMYPRPLSIQRRDRSSVDYSRRASPSLGRSLAPSTEQRGRSGRYLTTAMVPDAEDIY
ncbi:hypothetical protein BO94DRAFT_582903 [Aspergillus sclerotioniger CBS 115572]|uniref:Uncharacterized protein n=1 Tax=Aspergillus sclerotioniger CBS 115572 TaxID=1450535 RepID=A0A317X4J2_9EURO|nr:hypothetical protein BO94DRAFT_582903 [Aspergillus sclerotioniger CBS 115572]PWY93519.1 hypothetical protein BO94DRAFT_582903 [Aspergillus sclerotioniger CBS 115572]